MFESIGFIGAGRIARIMLGGWQKTGTHLPSVHVYDPSADALSALRTSFPQAQAASFEQTTAKALVLIALHPPAMEEALPQMAPCLREDAVVVSLAPRLRLPALREKLGGFDRLARLNPNAPSLIGQGFNPVSFSQGLPDEARAALLDVITPLGAAPVVRDDLIEACAAISAMGPTYFWFQFETLRHLAEEFGMPPDFAREAIAGMVHGAVDTLFAGGLSPSQVMDLVPVRPMAAEEASIRASLRERIGAVHARLTC